MDIRYCSTHASNSCFGDVSRNKKNDFINEKEKCFNYAMMSWVCSAGIAGNINHDGTDLADVMKDIFAMVTKMKK